MPVGLPRTPEYPEAMARFGAVVTAMVTPFDVEGALDLDGAAALARWLADHGSDGLVVAGTTGEGSVLTDDEKLDLWRAVSEAVTIPVVAGTGSNDTAHSVELARRAAGAGAAGVLVVTPYYNRPPQAGIEAHFRAVAAATTLPVLIYDIPVRTGRKVAHDVLVRLATEVPNVVGVKDAASDVPASARLVAATPDSFELYSGNDDHTLALLAVGAVGVVGVATHWCGPQMSELIAAFGKGDTIRAREVNTTLFESFAFESSDTAPNPIPAKAVMRALGLAVGECRLPMGPAPAGLEDQARRVLAGLVAR
ncbi:MAG: 4-hydroxy-tetrahydrodipicolinate synthase [Actinomycetota bacterium]|nr:4-hydroxy-tetrahydrodipicolinate synthase [Actinomycetota bacterium]